MYKRVIPVMLVGAVTAFAASSAPAANTPATPNPSQVCKTLRSQMGSAVFKNTYGTNHNRRNAFGKCVSSQAKLIDNNVQSAKSACKTEQTADPVAFVSKYGTNKNKNNAYGKCVSARAKAASDANVQATVNAAKQCKAERASDPAAFKAKYGTNKNKNNAFGKCVSRLASAKS